MERPAFSPLKEVVKDSYFSMMTKSAERLKKATGTVKALKRSSNFLHKIVENQNIEYKPVEKPTKFFFIGNLLLILTRTIPKLPNMIRQTENTFTAKKF